MHRNLINGVWIDCLGGFGPLNHIAEKGLLSKLEYNTCLIVSLADVCTKHCSLGVLHQGKWQKMNGHLKVSRNACFQVTSNKELSISLFWKRSLISLVTFTYHTAAGLMPSN